MNVARLKVGDKAPNFTTKDIRNHKVTPFQANKWTFISFHRFAACPFCVLRTNELIRRYDEFGENDIDIISIWPSSAEKMLKVGEHVSTPFPLVSDEKKVLFEKFGVTESSKSSMLKLFLHPKLVWEANKLSKTLKDEEPELDHALLPAEFLVNPKGEIVFAHYAEHYGDHVSVDKLLSFRKEVPTLEYA
ncbi:redoxin domain-containing protein [uncultured Arcticibacterium sp.]|uniref:redoxin domain-containing protein n=1 Tax=uncultured Arcticibacterium sp. TaxID=2173042 RepID=UPI0030F68C8E